MNQAVLNWSLERLNNGYGAAYDYDMDSVVVRGFMELIEDNEWEDQHVWPNPANSAKRDWKIFEDCHSDCEEVIDTLVAEDFKLRRCNDCKSREYMVCI